MRAGFQGPSAILQVASGFPGRLSDVDQSGTKFPEEMYDLFSEVKFLDFQPYTPEESTNAFPMAYLNPENRAKALEIISSETFLEIDKIYQALQSLIKDLHEAAQDTLHVLYNAILTALVIPLRTLKKWRLQGQGRWPSSEPRLRTTFNRLQC